RIDRGLPDRAAARAAQGPGSDGLDERGAGSRHDDGGIRHHRECRRVSACHHDYRCPRGHLHGQLPAGAGHGVLQARHRAGPAGPGAPRGHHHHASVEGMRRPMRLAEALQSERGFTLAELLVACAIIALVMAGLLVSLQAGQEAYLRGSNEVEATQSVRVAIERMAQELRVAGFCPTCTTAPPFTAITAQSATGFTIHNDCDGDGVITAAGTVTDAFGNVRGEQIVYAFAGGALTRQETGVDASPLTLATGINSLTFTYQDNAGVVTAGPDH